MSTLMPAVGEYLGATMKTILSSARPADDKPIPFVSTLGINNIYLQFKQKSLNPDESAKWRKCELKLIASRNSYSRAFESIFSHGTSIRDLKRERQTDHADTFSRSLKLIENEKLSHLAELLFDDDRDSKWTDGVAKEFVTAQRGFIDCWNHKDTKIHLYFRLAALRLAFYCDTYRQLVIEKNVQHLKVETYIAYLLPKLVKRLREQTAILSKVLEGNRKRNEHDVEAVTMFVSELLFFTIDSPDVLMRNAVAHHESITNTDKLTETEISEVTDWLIDIRSPIVRKPTAESIKDVVEWLTHARLIESSLTSRQLIITQKPMSLAKSIITSAYRHQFKDYDWGNGLEFEVNSNQSAPFENPFKLIIDGLIENRFIIITDAPAYLAKKIAFDYSTVESNRWNEYDLVLLADIYSNQPQSSHDTIIELVLNRLQTQFKINKNVCNFIKQNVQKYNNVLIIIDEFGVDNHCKQLDNIMKSDGSQINLSFDLIVIRRLSDQRAIDRTDKLTFLNMIKFDSKVNANFET